MKKRLCFIGYNIATCIHIRQEFEHYLAPHVEPSIWCLTAGGPPEDFGLQDLLIASSNTVLASVKSRLPTGIPILVADRTINTDNLDLLLDLAPGTRALVVGTSSETANQAVDTLNRFGFDYLELFPYSPREPGPYPGDIRLAITMGNPNLIPEGIPERINIGVRGIDLSTYVQIVYALQVPVEALNAISYDYIERLLKMSVRRQHLVRLNKTLTRNVEVILNTINNAIVSVNREGQIKLLNPAAERLLGISAKDAIGTPFSNYLPQIDVGARLESGEPIADDIRRYKDTHLVVTGTPMLEEGGVCTGMVLMLRAITEVEELETKVRRELKRKGNVARYSFASALGESRPLRDAIALARRFASSDMTILLEGESGTGKELFAQAIHNASPRREGPFVALNFAALPGELAESELFGCQHGAFTGAKSGGKQGLFEAAHRGTIFLDEISDASPDVQKKLLRVLEEREVRKIGSNIVTPIDVRVISATNANLLSLVEEHRFRSDLFYRLCALPISVPPLRERGEDIIILAQAFAERFSGSPLLLEPPLAEFLRNHAWPGNIRELQNVVKYICSVRAADEAVTIRHLPPYLIRSSPGPRHGQEPARPARDEFFALVEQIKSEGKARSAALLLSELAGSSGEDPGRSPGYGHERSPGQGRGLGHGLGRAQIMKLLEEGGAPLSEYALRSLLGRLQEAGCLTVGVTKQGSRITSRGIELLGRLSRPDTPA